MKISVQTMCVYRLLFYLLSGLPVSHVTWCFVLRGSVALRESVPANRHICVRMKVQRQFVGWTTEPTAPTARSASRLHLANGICPILESTLVRWPVSQKIRKLFSEKAHWSENQKVGLSW